jgi:hypothetical protein
VCYDLPSSEERIIPTYLEKAEIFSTYALSSPQLIIITIAIIILDVRPNGS